MREGRGNGKQKVVKGSAVADGKYQERAREGRFSGSPRRMCI